MPCPRSPLQSSKLKEVVPKHGLVFSEKSHLNEVLCKPKMMPIKSLTLRRMMNIENDLADQAQAQQAQQMQQGQQFR